MDFYKLADGTLVGTQAEARKSGQKWEAHAVPTDKQGLLDYLNGLNSGQKRPASDDSRGGALGQPTQLAPTALKTAPAAEPSATLPTIEAIQNAPVDEATHILEAALERFAELGEPARASLEDRALAFNGQGTGEPSGFFRRGAMTLAILAISEISNIKLPNVRGKWGAR